MTRLSLLLVAALAASARAQTIQPIESLWPTSPRLIGRPLSMTDGLKEWRPVFDAIILVKLPPTFVGDADFTLQAQTLLKEVGGSFVLATLPVGTEGWETSANQRLAERQSRQFEPAKAVPQPQWLETLEDIDSGTWAWILEQPARMPAPDQAARSAAEFVRFAKSRHKKAAIWLSAEAFGHHQFKELTRRICESTKDADYYGWMDLETESIRSGEANWLGSLSDLLDQILAVSPKEKTIIQFANNPKWPAKDVAGTIAYISACQAKGINRFCLMSGPPMLDRDPWRDFYRNLPRVRR